MITAFIDDFAVGPAVAFNGDTVSLDYRVVDVIRGAVTIRRPVPPALIFRSLLDRSSAALQILAVLRGGGALGLGAGSLRMSPMHAMLDGTEKGGASYRVGMALAHLLAQDLLDLREVRHVDPLVGGDVTLVAGRRRPDLIGLDANDSWSVVEAKGRTESPDADVLTGAKEQAENVNLVRNTTGAMVAPAARVASVADLSGNPIHVDFVDPPEPEERGSKDRRVYGVDEAGFVRNYYETIRDLEAVAGGLTGDVPGRPDGVEVRGARLPGSTIWLAVGKEIADAAHDSGDDAVAAVRKAQDGWNARTAKARTPGRPAPEVEDQSVRPVGKGDDDEQVAGDRVADVASEDRTSIGPDGYMVHIELGPDAGKAGP